MDSVVVKAIPRSGPEDSDPGLDTGWHLKDCMYGRR